MSNNEQDRIKGEQVGKNLAIKVYDPGELPWIIIANEVIEIERIHFGNKALNESFLRNLFLSCESTTVVIVDEFTSKIVGFTTAMPVDRVYNIYSEYNNRKIRKDSAYIEDTVIHPNYLRNHLVGKMMELLEQKLKEKGYKYLERDSTVDHHYADNIRKNYKGRIVEEKQHDSIYGPQVYFLIRL